MYRADYLVSDSIAMGSYHALAEAIREGCKIRPEKLKVYLRRRGNAACALGAAISAMEFGSNRRYKMPNLVARFPELQRLIQHPCTALFADLESVIISMNDHYNYSREAIADWLCHVGGCRHDVHTDWVNRKYGHATMPV
jgi:hypothetical protein